MTNPDSKPGTPGQSSEIFGWERSFRLSVEYCDQENDMRTATMRVASPFILISTEGKSSTEAVVICDLDPREPVIPQAVKFFIGHLSTFVFSPVAFFGGRGICEADFIRWAGRKANVARRGYYE